MSRRFSPLAPVRLAASLIVTLFLLLPATPASFASPPTPATSAATEESVRLGLYTGARREWSRAEVRGTFDLWGQELANKFKIPVSFFHYDDPVEMRRDFLSGKINGINTDVMTIVRLFKQDELADGYATIMKGGWKLLLFAGKASGVQSLDELTGKRIVLLEEDPVGELYLELLCLRHHQRPCRNVFADMQRVNTSNQALMRVFFGKADLALVFGYGHEVAVEMNPQLARSIVKLAEYPMYSQYFAFYSPKVDQVLRQRTLRIVPTLHTYARGRQLLDIFKVDQLEIATPALLQPIIDLEREYQHLRSQVERKDKRR